MCRFVSRLISAGVVVVILLLPARHALASDETTTTVRHADSTGWTQYTVSAGGKESFRFDLSEHLKNDFEIVPNYFQGTEPKLSPNKRYCAFVGVASADCFVLLVDLASKQVVRKCEAGEDYTKYGLRSMSIASVRWLNDQTLDTDWVGNRSHHHYHLICDVGRDQHKVVESGPTLIFDRSGEDYVSIWGEEYAYITNARMLPKLDDLPCETIRYNGLWVYPERIRGYTDPEGGERYYRDESTFPEIGLVAQKSRTAGRYRVFSKPTFIGDTRYVAFVEQVYAWADPEKTMSAELVILDAHRANSNPPSADDVAILRVPIPPVSIENGYTQFTKYVGCRWDSERAKVEIRKYGSAGGGSSVVDSVALDVRSLNR